MKKIIRLTESQLKKVIKKVISEATRPEPVVKYEKVFAVQFREGQRTLSDQVKGELIKKITPLFNESIETLSQFFNSSEPIPDLVILSVGTSSTGMSNVNASIANDRLKTLKGIIKQSFINAQTVRGAKMNPEIVESLMQVKTNYRPTSLDSRFYDRLTSAPLDEEREAYITIRVIESRGLGQTDIQRSGDQMRKGKGWYFMGLGDYDPKMILNGLRKLQTYTDIQDLDNELRNDGGLEEFLNRELKVGADEGYWKKEAVKAINMASNRSSKGNVARYDDEVKKLYINNI